MTYITQKINFCLKRFCKKSLPSIRIQQFSNYASAHSGLCPFGIVFIPDGVHSGLCPFRIVSIWDGVHLGLCPFGIEFIQDCVLRDGVHSGNYPDVTERNEL